MPVTRTFIPIPVRQVADILLPRAVERLYDFAYNLWWSWSPSARRLFAEIDREAWRLYRNPVQVLINVEPAHWEVLLESENFMAAYRDVVREFEAYVECDDKPWFARRYPDYRQGPIAYFSMEYGLHRSLAIYSGGLGVLSGDHLKSASDLGLPLVGVGLLYRHGYFRQNIDADGRQQHIYPEYDFSRLPLRPAETRTGKEVRVKIPLPGREVEARVWVAGVGRVPLLLLDTDVPQNDPADRPITGTLYVAGREMRLVQEIVAGVGGARALEALGIEPAVWHINEGHCSLLQLERLGRRVASGAEPEKALAELAGNAVFTTHTPVPAGNETFDRELARKYLTPWSEALRLSTERLLGLGDAGRGDGDLSFNMTALAIRTTRAANAVSKLNAEVSSEMWGHLLGDRSRDDRPAVFPITNGVHPATWVGREMLELFRGWIGPGWQEKLLDEAAWKHILDIPDARLWAAHGAQKERLVRFIRSRLRDQFARHGHSPDELRAVADLFDPKALTIGFARRFATYKRAKLIFSDLERLKALLGDDERPIQMLFAGKAHPADRPGQELIQHIFQLSRSEALKGRVFFIEDYDMRVGHMLVQGVDVWLNTPRRPMEASGTSGQKAAMNGALNVSILDGWWPEGFDGTNGWAIEAEGDDDGNGDEAGQDRGDAEALYRLLEEEVVPAYYGLDGDHLPAGWIQRMKRSIATVTPRFSSNRMVRDYAEEAYFPGR